ncbi:PAS domain S-box protein [Hoeflea sp. YIM 152468]|uniref:sensor histidine kinase n=1 Tax=Hoeflea sp. YIM 152468 TaxID=3031759 RepID=UPI0023DA1168|nr:PAS domain S-box protein [Hoeflea sp. YIM 152468]MDF1607970.1 PAS domain S-box protein [Hoeflea sp. YIM 152468]
MPSSLDDRQRLLDGDHRLQQLESAVREAQARHDAAAFLAAIVESSDDAIVSKSLAGIITSWNKAAERLFGYTACEAIGRPVTLIIPEDRLDEEPAILARIHAGDQVDHFETVRRRKDGTLIDISLTVSPIRDGTGTIIGASKIARDISERKKAAQHQELLLREMHHRVKNLFAIIGGIIALSARAAQTPADLAATVRSRLLALSRVHEMSLPNLVGNDPFKEKSITLFELLADTLAPYEIDGVRQWELKGDDLTINGEKLTKLALLFHEFATNAAKYGSLSSAEGSLDIAVAVQGDLLELRWSETKGPGVRGDDGNQEPGFGSKLEQTIAQSLQAAISRDWQPHGLTIRLAIPVQILASD